MSTIHDKANRILQHFNETILAGEAIRKGNEVPVDSVPYVVNLLRENKALFSVLKLQTVKLAKGDDTVLKGLSESILSLKDTLVKLQEQTLKHKVRKGHYSDKCLHKVREVSVSTNRLVMALVNGSRSVDAFIRDSVREVRETPVVLPEKEQEEEKCKEPKEDEGNVLDVEEEDVKFDPYFGRGRAARLCRVGDRLLFGVGAVRSCGGAFRAYQEAAQQGSARACVSLGDMMEQGLGTLEKNDRKAVEWYERALEIAHDEPTALCRLGLMAAEGRGGVAQSFAQAYKRYLLAVENKWDLYAAGEAANHLGFMFEHGMGVKEDTKEAEKWYRRGAEEGNDKAQNNLGAMFFRGHGIDKSSSAAAQWWALAAAQGNACAMNHLGMLYERGEGVPMDLERAENLYAGASQRGNGNASTNWGHVLLMRGHANEAARLFRLGADRGCVDALFELGLLYLDGSHVEGIHAGLAFSFLGAAAERGHVAAAVLIGKMFESGAGIVEKDVEEAVSYYETAAKNGDKEGMYALARCLWSGQGVERDCRGAQSLWEQAAQLGHEKAEEALEQISIGLDPRTMLGVTAWDIAARLERGTTEA